MADLAVLLAQAGTLNDLFQSAVGRWISGLGAEHKSTLPVKRRNRAIEKLFRSYGGDAGLVIDLVRAGVTFRTIEDMTTCFERICEDDDVAILQVKNRLRSSYDGRESAGYRNVALSLIYVDDTTMRLGVDAHICELQLGLEAIDALKNEDGHKNYVRWRNATAQ